MSTIDTGTQELLASKENGVGILTMNRPEARNAMSGEMNAAMQEMLAQFETDTDHIEEMSFLQIERCMQKLLQQCSTYK